MLADSEAMRYARQLLLPEIGEQGQALLCAAQVRIGVGDARACEIASSYLTRAGMTLMAADDDAGFELEMPVSSQVAQLAGDPRLQEAAAWLAGSFAAVEAIKRVVNAGQSAQLPSGFLLGNELT